MSAVVRVGDYGFVIQDTLTRDGSAVDVSAASTRTMKFEDPDGNTTSKTASFATDGTNGKINYTVDSDLFDQAGVWKQSTVVTDGSTFQFEGEFNRIRVEAAV